MTYMQIKYDTNELSLVTVLDAQFTMTYIEEDIHIQIKDRVISEGITVVSNTSVNSATASVRSTECRHFSSRTF